MRGQHRMAAMMKKGAAAPFYLAGGIDKANVLAAYQPKGAASLAASYINLANPGTGDATVTTPPTFDASRGWIFNGTSQFIKTGIVPDANTSVIIKFTDVPYYTTAPHCILGTEVNSGAYDGLTIYPVVVPTAHRIQKGKNTDNKTGRIQSTIYAISGQNVYLN